MKLLLLGSGGREHALAWKIAQSPKIEKLYIAPGNAGTREVGENVAICNVIISRQLDIKALLLPIWKKVLLSSKHYKLRMY